MCSALPSPQRGIRLIGEFRATDGKGGGESNERLDPLAEMTGEKIVAFDLLSSRVGIFILNKWTESCSDGSMEVIDGVPAGD